jgi:hypothetical protein
MIDGQHLMRVSIRIDQLVVTRAKQPGVQNLERRQASLIAIDVRDALLIAEGVPPSGRVLNPGRHRSAIDKSDANGQMRRNIDEAYGSNRCPNELAAAAS